MPIYWSDLLDSEDEIRGSFTSFRVRACPPEPEPAPLQNRTIPMTDETVTLLEDPAGCCGLYAGSGLTPQGNVCPCEEDR